MVYKFHFPTTKKRELLKELRGSLLSVAGLMGRKIINQEGEELGVVVDLVCHWDNHETYPPLTGVIARLARRKVWIPASSIQRIEPKQLHLGSARLDLREFKPRKGEVRLSSEVLDHQLIDVNGARVVRASDLYLAPIGDKTHLVGVDIGFKPILRRLGPKSLRNRALPDVVIDWATIQSFGGKEAKKQLKLSGNRQELRRMRPGELADLLEDLGRPERRELLNALNPELAADALEEMEPKELESLIRESSLSEAASYLSIMEPDEAADALRDIDNKLRNKLIKLMPEDSVAKVNQVLNYDEQSAGGIMNTLILSAPAEQTVAELKARLKTNELDPSSLSAVALVDKRGKLLYDLPLSNLLTAEEQEPLKDLMKPPASVSVRPEASFKEVAELLIESRSSSIVVADAKERPLGRILADDLIDVLLPSERVHFPRLLSS